MATRKALTGLAFGEDETEDLEREADLVFNPFPATLVVRVPTEPESRSTPRTAPTAGSSVL